MAIATKTKPTIRQLIANSTLTKVEVKLILRHVLNMSQAQLIMQQDYSLNQTQLAKFTSLCQQVQQGVPLNYLLKYKEFYSRKFFLTKATLIPRPETELLVEQVLAKVQLGDNVLDLGTGSGCIAITCKLENPSLNIVAIDNYSATLAVAKKNAKMLGANIKFLLSNWYDKVVGKFNLIVSNPPYIAKQDKHLAKLSYEPQHALTDFADGLECLRKIIAYAPNYLLPRGWLVLEHGFKQKQQVQALLLANGFSHINTLCDYANLDRITLAQYLK